MLLHFEPDRRSFSWKVNILTHRLDCSASIIRVVGKDAYCTLPYLQGEQHYVGVHLVQQFRCSEAYWNLKWGFAKRNSFDSDMLRHSSSCNTSFTRYNRFDNRLHCVNKPVVIPVVKLVWQPIWQPCWTNSHCSFNRFERTVTVRSTVLNEQRLFVQPVVKPSCTTGLSTGSPVECLCTQYNQLSNRFENRLYRVNGA